MTNRMVQKAKDTIRKYLHTNILTPHGRHTIITRFVRVYWRGGGSAGFVLECVLEFILIDEIECSRGAATPDTCGMSPLLSLVSC